MVNHPTHYYTNWARALVGCVAAMIIVIGLQTCILWRIWRPTPPVSATPVASANPPSYGSPDRDRALINDLKRQLRESRRHRVVKIVDGDTLDIEAPSGIRTRIRLCGIDTPERGEPGFAEATAALAELAADTWVTVLPQKQDGYQRTVALVFVEGGAELAQTMADNYPHLVRDWPPSN